MGERREVCGKKGNECQRLALVAEDAAIRLMYLDLVNQRRELAEYSETAQDTLGGATAIH
jgi:hypothetical protein